MDSVSHFSSVVVDSSPNDACSEYRCVRRQIRNGSPTCPR